MFTAPWVPCSPRVPCDPSLNIRQGAALPLMSQTLDFASFRWNGRAIKNNNFPLLVHTSERGAKVFVSELESRISCHWYKYKKEQAGIYL